MLAASEDGFLSAVAQATNLDDVAPMRHLFRELAPHSVGCGIELGPHTIGTLPDFGCSVSPSFPIACLPPRLAQSPSYESLTSLIGPECVSGPWFFELDALADGIDFGGPHAFARLKPECRSPSVLSLRVAERAGRCSPEIAPVAIRAAAVARIVPSDLLVSDIGIVGRPESIQMRLGVSTPAAKVRTLLAECRATQHDWNAVADKLDRCRAVPATCTVQIGVSGRGDPWEVTGIELHHSAENRAAWAPLLESLASIEVLPEHLLASALAWPGSTRLPRQGDGWAPVLSRAISHVKLVLHEGDRVTTKIYLAAGEVFSLFA